MNVQSLDYLHYCIVIYGLDLKFTFKMVNPTAQNPTETNPTNDRPINLHPQKGWLVSATTAVMVYSYQLWLACKRSLVQFLDPVSNFSFTPSHPVGPNPENFQFFVFIMAFLKTFKYKRDIKIMLCCLNSYDFNLWVLYILMIEDISIQSLQSC